MNLLWNHLRFAFPGFYSLIFIAVIENSHGLDWRNVFLIKLYGATEMAIPKLSVIFVEIHVDRFDVIGVNSDIEL